MPSFDVVSEVDLQEVRNAVDQAARELRTRFDFKGVDASFEYADGRILLAAMEEFQLAQMLDILKDKLNRRGVDVRALDPGAIEAAGKQKRQGFALKQGIDRDTAKRLVKIIKDSRLKVQSQIQGEQVRVTGKKRDDLQQTIAAMKDAGLDIPLDFTNFRD
ncbi:MAG: YajQ family cyclic di-GMP-binding protein [Pseudomonadales bacterium]|nr:YajQ family cyclic di-GMP-binding protein [Pseudomonadales bacterium]NIX08959.1 YajQ family cyclic di-GMP-binding protein [Pseudomonadales bacterium]